ncbi:hypothetical protein [Thioalkalivibrio thiocyanodenitrificans]|uniref:hypothetical protein n=1 Tax=Thioalkalivibrio thiocyanodenitrificans TaxID=243063 RepID=UPI000373D3F2|nr:hypothetical protein [Thioalkalivibrio thiocyanodenitrificans]
MKSMFSTLRGYRGISISALALAGVLVLGGCAAPAPQMTSLEIQAFQLKEFETDKTTAFNSTVSVFQDLGYIIDTASLETGIITSQSPTESGFIPFVGMTQTNTRATAFVEERRPGATSIRLNFVEVQKRSGGYGQQSGRDNVILDPAVYENAFEKIEEAVFIRSAGT